MRSVAAALLGRLEVMLDELVEKFLTDCHVPLLVLEILLLTPVFFDLLNELSCVFR